MKTTLTLSLCFVLLGAFAQHPDKFVGRWKQVEGSIQVIIGKEKGKQRYTTKVIIDSVVNSSTGVYVRDGSVIPVQLPPLEADHIKFKYDEKTKMLIGFWPAKNKTIKLIKY